MNRQRSGDSVHHKSVEQQQPRKTFGWKPLYDTSSVSSVSSRPEKKAPASPETRSVSSERYGGSPKASSSSPMLLNQKRPSRSMSQSACTSIARKPSYLMKRDRTVSASSPVIQPQRSMSNTSTSLLSPSSPRSTPGRLYPHSPSSTATPPSPYKPPPLYPLSPSTPMKQNPGDSTIEKLDFPEVVPLELQQKLETNELVELTPQPERGALSSALQSLDVLEEECTQSAVMKVRNPVTKLRDRNAELDAIVDNVRGVLRRIADLRNK